MALPLHAKPLRRVVQNFASAVTPSFLSTSNPRHKSANTTLHPTAYLSGVRGIAAVIVCFTHYICHEYRLFRYGYQSAVPKGVKNFFGYKKEYLPQENTHIVLQLPLIRILVSARAMVITFFLVSGFSISYGSIKALKRNDPSRLYKGLSSSIFRRGLRLYLPILFFTFWTEIWACIGLYNYPFGDGGSPDPAGSSIIARMSRTWYVFQNTIFPNSFHSRSAQSRYNGHLWTIPIEYNASLAVYLAITAFANFQPKFRLLFEVLAAIEINYAGNPLTALFLCGLILAELHHIRSDWEKATGHTIATYLQTKYAVPSRIVQGIWMGIAFLAVFIMSSPENSWDSVGYKWLNSIHISLDGKIRIGCILLMLSVDNSIPLQKIFTTSVAQYLGDVSYALYIVHIWVLQSFRNPIMASIELILPGAPLSILMILQAFVTIPLNIWVADMFWRFVDEPSVSFAKWLFVSFLPHVEEERPALV